jgi:acetyl esterase
VRASWRRKIRDDAETAAFDGAVRAYASLVRVLPESDPAKHGVEVTPDLPYVESATSDQRIDVYRRESPAREPALLYVHGGGFARLSRQMYWLVALGLARRGFTVFVMDHRRAPVHRYPAAHEDVAAAALWVRDNAARFGADPERIVAAGDSTGANLVTALALATAYRFDEPWAQQVFDSELRLSAVAPACGFLEVSDVSRFASRAEIPRWIGSALEAPGRDYCMPRGPHDATPSLVDPLVVLERSSAPERALPAFLATVGDRDPLAEDTLRLSRALRRVGGRCDTRTYSGGVHGFHTLFPWQKRSIECWNDHHRFLRRHTRSR